MVTGVSGREREPASAAAGPDEQEGLRVRLSQLRTDRRLMRIIAMPRRVSLPRLARTGGGSGTECSSPALAPGRGHKRRSFLCDWGHDGIVNRDSLM